MFCFVLILSKTIVCIYQTYRNVLSGNKYPSPSHAVVGLMSIFQNVSDSLLMFFRPPNSFFFPGCGFTMGADCSLKEKMASKSVRKWCIKAYKQNVYKAYKVGEP